MEFTRQTPSDDFSAVQYASKTAFHCVKYSWYKSWNGEGFERAGHFCMASRHSFQTNCDEMLMFQISRCPPKRTVVEHSLPRDHVRNQSVGSYGSAQSVFEDVSPATGPINRMKQYRAQSTIAHAYLHACDEHHSCSSSSAVSFIVSHNFENIYRIGRSPCSSEKA